MKPHRKNRRLKKFLLWFAIIFAALIIAFLIYFKIAVTLNPPKQNDLSVLDLERTKIEKDFYVCGNNWLRKNDAGIWEMYIEGDAFERGVINGKLTKELIENQEQLFVDFINKMIPSKSYMKFLKYFVGWFNRDIDSYIKEEYLREIYGVSFSSSDKFSYISSAYHRILIYHAAHDIGHALQDMNLAGCTSFSVWNDRSKDSSLIVGRNFDFSIGDDFAKDKIVMFVNPDKGHKFMMLTWGGMIGAVSGMNEKGLTVTMNAAKSSIPAEAKTPISILAREILQYASNIDEAYDIAKKRDVFVSELLMIGSKEDNKTAIIEKSPEKIALFKTDSNYIVCSNHFQSDVLKNDENNKKHIKESSSMHRYKRVNQLMKNYQKLDVYNSAEILRDQKALNNKNIGIGNEKAINQLIAHHSIIFKPTKKLVWVSSYPYQINEYICYDLEKIFQDFPALKENTEICQKALNIPADSFLFSKDYENFKKFKKTIQLIQNSIDNDKDIELSDKDFINTNPEHFMTYLFLGNYYYHKKEYQKSFDYYKISISKDVNSLREEKNIEEKIKNCKELLK